jgi:RNA recognition motif-containing protein
MRHKKAAKSTAVGDDVVGTNNNRVYVGNLSYGVTWRELKDHMRGGDAVDASWDVVRADVLVGHDGRSRGCGIVEYSTIEEAQSAILALNDTELLGRKIFVREDREGPTTTRPTADGGGGGANIAGVGGGGGGGSGSAYAVAPASSSGMGGGDPSHRVYVGNLAYEVAWQDLKDHMRNAGDVLRAEVMTMHDGRSKGCGIVEYAHADGASRAIAELNDTELMGRKIFVREDREGGSGNGGGGGGGGGGMVAREGDGGYLAGGWHRGNVAAGGGGPRGNGGNLSVYVGNLAYETTWQELKDHMRAAGNVDKVRLSLHPCIDIAMPFRTPPTHSLTHLAIVPESDFHPYPIREKNQIRPTSSNRPTADPRDAASCCIRNRTRSLARYASSRIRSCTAVPSTYARIASRAAAAAVDTITRMPEATETPIAAVIRAADTRSSSSSVPDSPPPASPSRTDVSSSSGTSRGRPVGASSRITSASTATSIAPRSQRAPTVARGGMARSDIATRGTPPTPSMH